MYKVSFTGYRPQKLPFRGESDPACADLKRRIYAEIFFFYDKVKNLIYTKFLGYVPEGEEAELITNIDDSCLYYEFLHFMDEKMYSVEPVMVSTPSYEFQPMADVEKEFLSPFTVIITSIGTLPFFLALLSLIKKRTENNH